jgi:hypothetical protein
MRYVASPFMWRSGPPSEAGCGSGRDLRHIIRGLQGREERHPILVFAPGGGPVGGAPR